MIGLFNSKGERLPITWQGYDFNGPADSLKTFNGAEQEGCFVDAITTSTPINYQSEVQNELAKQGGGIEFYNPRIASRVLNMRARVQMATLEKLYEHLNYIQTMFSPMYLQYAYSGWPIVGGRPQWADPWTTDYLPLHFWNITDASINAGLAPYVGTGIKMHYAVAPLALPDPTISAIGTGWGATVELSWLLLDGGIAMHENITTLNGNGSTTPSFSTIPLFPKLEFDTTGTPATNLTATLTTSDPLLPSSVSIVMNASSIPTGKNVDIIVRDREVFVAGIQTVGIVTSATWPVISPNYATTVTWSNTTNTANHNLKYYEAFSA